jgi:hypothetical protein
MAVTYLHLASGHSNTPALSAGRSISKTMVSTQSGSYRVIEGYPKIVPAYMEKLEFLAYTGSMQIKTSLFEPKPKFIRDFALPDYVRCLKCCLVFYI